MSQDLAVAYDEAVDVLYVRRAECASRRSAESPSDGLLLMAVDNNGETVGLTVIGASGLTNAEWDAHPDRALIPDDLHSAVEMYIKSSPW